MKGRILIIFLTLIGLLLFPPFAYSKIPFLFKWEDNDRISIRTGSNEVISKSTEGGETITLPYVKTFPSWKMEKDEEWMLKKIEFKINGPDGSHIKTVVLNDKEKLEYPEQSGMSPKGNHLIYYTQKNGKLTLWACPLLKETTPIAVFTQESFFFSAISPDETRFALIANGGEWGHSVLIVHLDDVTNPVKVTEVEEGDFHSDICWSPDGKYLVYDVGGKGHKGYLVSVDGSQKTLLTEKMGSAYSFAWGENKLYFSANRILTEVDILNPDKPRMLLELPEDALDYFIEYSPDRSKVAVVTQERLGHKDSQRRIFKLLWNYVYKDEPWKELFEYKPVIQNP